MTQPPKNGEKVKIKPTGNPVPYPVTLRRGLMGSGQNARRIQPLRRLTKEAEVKWDEWWARRWVHGEIELVASKKKTKTKEDKKGGKD